jgi:REP element-mobilizing transposase RayT
MSKFDPKIYHRPSDSSQGRRSIRLKGYDYSQAGAYFVTIVAYQRECLFGEIVDGETPKGGVMVLNEFGRLIEKWWHQIPVHFPNVEILSFVIMPNHIHGIILITDDGRGAVSAPDDDGQIEHTGGRTPPLRARKPSLGQVVAYFKYQSTKEMNKMGGTGTITKFWQRNYFERIIRDEREMDRIHRYIESNPSQWADDDENPANE